MIQLLYHLVYLKMVHEDLHGTMLELISLCGLTAVSFTELLNDVTSWLRQVVFTMVLWQDYVVLFFWLNVLSGSGCQQWQLDEVILGTHISDGRADVDINS